MRPIGFGNRTFDGYVIDLSRVVYELPFIVKVGIGAFSDGEDSAVGGEVVDLLQRLTDL
jgi:hypothetical protein